MRSLRDLVLATAVVSVSTAVSAYFGPGPRPCPQPGPQSVEMLFALCLAAARFAAQELQPEPFSIRPHAPDPTTGPHADAPDLLARAPRQDLDRDTTGSVRPGR